MFTFLWLQLASYLLSLLIQWGIWSYLLVFAYSCLIRINLPFCRYFSPNLKEFTINNLEVSKQQYFSLTKRFHILAETLKRPEMNFEVIALATMPISCKIAITDKKFKRCAIVYAIHARSCISKETRVLYGMPFVFYTIVHL